MTCLPLSPYIYFCLLGGETPSLRCSGEFGRLPSEDMSQMMTNSNPAPGDLESWNKMAAEMRSRIDNDSKMSLRCSCLHRGICFSAFYFLFLSSLSLHLSQRSIWTAHLFSGLWLPFLALLEMDSSLINSKFVPRLSPWQFPVYSWDCALVPTVKGEFFSLFE